MTKDKQIQYIQEVIMSICEKYNYDINFSNKENRDEVSKTYEFNKLNWEVNFKGSKDTFSLADVISLVYHVFKILGFKKVLVNLNKDILEKEKVKDYLDLLDIEYDFDIKKDLNKEQIFNIILNSQVKIGEAIYLSEGINYKLDINKLLEEMLKEEINIPLNNSLDIFVCYQAEEEKETALYLIQDLRLNGFICETAYLGEKIDNQLKKANQLNSKYVIILNEKDIKNFEVCIKDNKTKEEKKIQINDLVDYLDMNM